MSLFYSAVSCPPNSTGTNVSTGCSCNAGFSGNITATTIAPAYYTGSCTLCSALFTPGTIAACTTCTAASCSVGTCKAGYNTFTAGSTPSCAANTCSCPNGTATGANGVGGTLCEITGAVDCSICDAGFALNASAALGSQACTGLTTPYRSLTARCV